MESCGLTGIVVVHCFESFIQVKKQIYVNTEHVQKEYIQRTFSVTVYMTQFYFQSVWGKEYRHI